MTYLSEVLADSPNLYWRLGEPSGTTAVSQVNSPTIDGTYVNTPTLGVTGALTVSGDSDTAVTLTAAQNEEIVFGGDNALLHVGDVFTVELWFKRTRSGTAENLVSTVGGSFNIYFDTDDVIHVDWQDNAANVWYSSVTVTDTSWHHLALTKNGSTRKLYLDSVDRTTLGTNQTFTNATAFHIGHKTNYFDGSFDEVALYPTALTQARVQAHYTAATEGVAAYTILNGSDEQLVNVNAGGTDVDAASYKDGVALTNAELAALLSASFGKSNVAVLPNLTGVADARQIKKTTFSAETESA